MRRLAYATTLAMGLIAFAGAAWAEEKCPKGDAPIFEEDLAATADCAAAHKLHDACAWGSSGDARLAGVVIDKCEATFLSRLTPAQKRNYDARVQHCSDKYAREEGTIAISEAAMCQEEVAVAFAKNAAAALVKTTPLPPVRASFDCRKAQSPLELLICADEDLAGADIDLAEAYKKAFKEAAPDFRSALIASENAWLAHVSATCLSVDSAQDVTRLCATSHFVNRVSQIPFCVAKAGDARTACLRDYDHWSEGAR
jgi:uncharacterized protein YecT (DUF1311 family)